MITCCFFNQHQQNGHFLCNQAYMCINIRQMSVLYTICFFAKHFTEYDTVLENRKHPQYSISVCNYTIFSKKHNSNPIA